MKWLVEICADDEARDDVFHVRLEFSYLAFILHSFLLLLLQFLESQM